MESSMKPRFYRQYFKPLKTNVKKKNTAMPALLSCLHIGRWVYRAKKNVLISVTYFRIDNAVEIIRETLMWALILLLLFLSSAPACDYIFFSFFFVFLFF